MPSKVYNNVEGFRMLDGSLVIEDVTSVTLPTIEHPTTEIKAAGMAGDVDMPNLAHINAMSYSVAHNNGLNTHVLAEPRRHEQELRVARQCYNVQTSMMEHKSVKCRFVGVPVKTDKGNVENDNPISGTQEYSCLRYEEEIDGIVVLLVDLMAGILKWNGVDYMLDVNKFLE